MTVSRAEVYAVCDGEREHQDSRSRESETGGLHTVTEWAAYLAAYGQELLRVGSFTWGEECRLKQLDLIRKIMAMSVACQEQNGVVPRVEPQAETQVVWRARSLYTKSCDSLDIHSNRFPGWGELSEEQRAPWLKVAGNLL